MLACVAACDYVHTARMCVFPLLSTYFLWQQCGSLKEAFYKVRVRVYLPVQSAISLCSVIALSDAESELFSALTSFL